MCRPIALSLTPLNIVIVAFSNTQVGYVANAGSFFIYLIAFALFQLVSETIGMLCAICSRNATYAVLVRCALYSRASAHD